MRGCNWAGRRCSRGETGREVPSARAQPQPRPEGGWWGSIRRWFGAEGWARPAFAVLALCVLVQNIGLLGGRDAPDEDEVRFRDVPAAPRLSPPGPTW
jgi:hypothetical protein